MSNRHLNFHHPVLPQSQDNIDWDQLAENYLDQLLSPWHPLMLQGNPCRNRVAQFFKEHPLTSQTRLADYGCGNAYLLSHIQTCGHYLGIDQSSTFLASATVRASNAGIHFTPMHADFKALAMPDAEKFDFVVSVNSILPKTRQEVLESFRSVVRNLKPSGTFVAILPAYDATLALRDAWQQHHAKRHGEPQAAQYRDYFNVSKRANDQECAYADDGRHIQCYHTQQTIRRELPACGLSIIQIEKVLYPHDLAQKFDYAFPGPSQEIWDWFVLAHHPNSSRQ